MKKLLNERSHKLFKKLFENQGVDTKKYENYTLEEGPYTSARHDQKVGSPGTRGWEDKGRTKKTADSEADYFNKNWDEWVMHSSDLFKKAAAGDLSDEVTQLRNEYPGWGNDNFARVYHDMEGEWPHGFAVDKFSTPDLIDRKPRYSNPLPGVHDLAQKMSAYDAKYPETDPE